jgi:hypothetical protein
MKAQFCAPSLLDGVSSKRSATNPQQIQALALVFIREQCDAESEHPLHLALPDTGPGAA